MLVTTQRTRLQRRARKLSKEPAESKPLRYGSCNTEEKKLLLKAKIRTCGSVCYLNFSRVCIACKRITRSITLAPYCALSPGKGLHDPRRAVTENPTAGQTGSVCRCAAAPAGSPGSRACCGMTVGCSPARELACRSASLKSDGSQ